LLPGGLTMAAMCPLVGQPDEVGRVVCFLAHDASAYITGQVWGINGGLDM
jgi:acetoacetyl-CoA reductase